MKNESLTKSYTKETISKTLDKIRKHDSSHEDLGENSDKIFNEKSSKNEYRGYIQYLLSDEFKKEKYKFESEILEMIHDRFSKSNEAITYMYLILAFLFALQILMWILVK